MLSFELWPEGMGKNWLILTSYGIKRRQAAFGALSMSALLLLLSTPLCLQRPRKSAPEGTVRAGGPPSSTLISPTPEWPSITFLRLFFLGGVYTRKKKGMDRKIVHITECIWMGDEDKKVYVEGKE